MVSATYETAGRSSSKQGGYQIGCKDNIFATTLLSRVGGGVMSDSSNATNCNAEVDYPPLMREQIAALRDYAQKYGPTWKAQLRQDWLCPLIDPLLRHLHNSHGLVWLNHFKLPE
jgi:hypothetical protein